MFIFGRGVVFVSIAGHLQRKNGRKMMNEFFMQQEMEDRNEEN
jgi:hypothetical protein